MIHLKDIISEINEEHTCYNCGQSVDINEAGFKFVIRNKKKIKKLICPPGTKSINRKKCKRMSSTERQKRLKGLKITRRKAKAKLKKTLRKRAKSMKKRQSMGLKSEGIPKFPRINMGFGEAQDYSKMMIKKSQDVFKSTRGGDLGKAKKAVKDMEEIVVQIKRVLGI